MDIANPYMRDLHQEGLPDGVSGIRGIGLCPTSNIRDKLPVVPEITTSIDIDVGACRVPRISTCDDRSSGVLPILLLELDQSRVGGHAVAVDQIRDVRDPFPCDAVVFALEDGEVAESGDAYVAGTVGGCYQESSVGELDLAGVDCAVGWEDDVLFVEWGRTGFGFYGGWVWAVVGGRRGWGFC